MKKTLIYLIIGSVCMLAVSCSTSGVTSPGGSMTNSGLKAMAFNVKGVTVGDACSTRILGVDWSRLFHQNVGSVQKPTINRYEGKGVYGIYFQAYVDYLTALTESFTPTDFAKHDAVHQALTKVPNANYFVTTSTIEKNSSSLFISERCVTVRGQALQVTGSSVKKM